MRNWERISPRHISSSLKLKYCDVLHARHGDAKTAKPTLVECPILNKVTLVVEKSKLTAEMAPLLKEVRKTRRTGTAAAAEQKEPATAKVSKNLERP